MNTTPMFNTPPFRRHPQVSNGDPCLAKLQLPCYPYNEVVLLLKDPAPKDEDTVAAWGAAITALDVLPLLYELAALVAKHTADATPNRGRLGILRAKYDALAERTTNSNATLLRGLRSRMLPVPEPVALTPPAGTQPTLPEGVPAPPEGFTYWGDGPLYCKADYTQASDVLRWWCREWNAGWEGTLNAHWALRAGSAIAAANGLSVAPVCNQEPLDSNAIPEGIPALPEGWVYWGKRPLPNPAVAPSADIALYVGGIAQWDFTRWRGFAHDNHYAVRLGSEIALANGLVSAAPPEAGPPAEAPPIPEGFAYWGFGSLTVLAGDATYDCVGWNGGNEWTGPLYGASDTNHHCLRIGSSIALANGFPTPEVGPVVMPMATPPATPTIPAPPAGFLLYGAGPLAVLLPDTAGKLDVLGYGTEDDEHWTFPCAGTRTDWHYALREGSSIALANGLC